MKLNQEFIQQLRNGEIAVENNGTLGQLIEVLKAAFPEDVKPEGKYKYYYVDPVVSHEWDCDDFSDLPVKSISDFYQPELFTGWAKDDDYPEWMGCFKGDEPKFGFDALGEWCDEIESLFSKYSEGKNNRPATHEEIETTLIKEANRRFYKEGNTIKGVDGTSHWVSEIILFHYVLRQDRLYTNQGCIVYERGQWAEIVEKPKPQPKKSTSVNYLVDGVEYSLNYQELKERYEDVTKLTDKEFMDSLPEIAHLACIISYFKGLSNNATIGDQGIIHELIHLMTSPEEPTNDLQEIREKFNKLIQLV